jgi:hypothetical protein
MLKDVFTLIAIILLHTASFYCIFKEFNMFIGHKTTVANIAVPHIIKTKLSPTENKFYSIILMVTLPKGNTLFLLVFCCQVPFQEVFMTVNPATLDIGYRPL